MRAGPVFLNLLQVGIPVMIVFSELETFSVQSSVGTTYLLKIKKITYKHPTSSCNEQQ
jgi:hypothetical protein